MLYFGLQTKETGDLVQALKTRYSAWPLSDHLVFCLLLTYPENEKNLSIKMFQLYGTEKLH